jgi:hypothetical protein
MHRSIRETIIIVLSQGMPWRIAALTFLLTLALGSSPPSPPPAEEKDSYEIYSILLRAEMPPSWKVTTWAIKQQTTTFPHLPSRQNFSNVRGCLNVSQDQQATYMPVIQDYEAKNNKPLVLARKFDLPQYSLVEVGPNAIAPTISRTPSINFEVSAVGFNPERTRALVYVGHHCGQLCGGGQYHLLVKTREGWVNDREFRGISCAWAS